MGVQQDEIKNISMDELLQKLETNIDGLSSREAERRLQKYGKNTIPEKKTNFILKFLSYFWGPIPWMIESASVLSAFVHQWDDFYIILTLLFINAVVGFWEEFQAGNTIQALRGKLATKSIVRRDGRWGIVPASDLVPGDLVRLKYGEIVPADVIFWAGDPIEVDQSLLTGESLPVEKKKGDTVYSGSIVKHGESEAYVYATNLKTYFGRTSQLVEGVQTVSHLQRAVLRIGNYLIVIALLFVFLILSVALFRGEEMLTILQFCLILTVAAIPVAMPTVLSITLAVGARILALKHAIVTRLSSIEELAGINILCSDKTGTLTQNKLILGEPFTIGDIDRDGITLYAALASKEGSQDQIDKTIHDSLRGQNLLQSFRIVHFTPFDPVRKCTQAKVQGLDGKIFFVAKGAPQVILSLSSNADRIREYVDKAIEDFAVRGFRSLGVARADVEGDWQFLGILPMFDPPREDAKETIKIARNMGINVKMLTGDQIAIAKETAKRLELGTNIMDASLLGDVQCCEAAQLQDYINKADGFAQVFPEDKYHIIDVLKKGGNLIGMTGDGVNDAPALKKSDVGIAVSGATDAARAASAIVLLEPGLSVIIDAIQESRKIFQRMNSYVIYRISETIRVLLFMTLSILVFSFYPVTAIMIVLLALLNDGAIISIAYDHVHYSNKPEKWNLPQVLQISTILGIAGVLASFGLFYLGERTFHLSREVLQSLMYLKLSVAGHMTIFVTRTVGPFWSIRPSWIFFSAIIATQIIATFIAVYGIFMAPIGWFWAFFVWGYSFIWFLFNDRLKLFVYKRLNGGSEPI